jgi:hypothetical protein
MKLEITYWQSHKYRLIVDSDEVLPALRDFEGVGEYGATPVAEVIADLEAGRVPRDWEVVAAALEEDGQLVAGDGAGTYDADEPGDYEIAVVPE